MTTKELVCFCALILFAAGPVHATEQRKDEIVLDGGTHDLLNFPLGDAGEWSKAVQATLRGNVCSGAWRGYKAFWEVRDEQLWLVKVLDNPCGDTHTEIPLNLIVPNAGSTPAAVILIHREVLPYEWTHCLFPVR